MNRYFRELVGEYKNNRTLRTIALLEAGLTPSQIARGETDRRKRLIADAEAEMNKPAYPARGTYDNGVVYSRRFRLTKTYHNGLAHVISVKINRLIKRRLRQRMAPVKAKRSGSEVYIYVARGNWQALEGLLPSIFHTTNMIYKYFEKDYNLQ